MSEDEIKTLYALAKQALADKNYDSAIDSLKRILVLDENYRDASRLLAQTVRLKRRRWYNDWRIWGPMIGIVAIGLLIWLIPKISFPAQVAPITEAFTASPAVTLPSTFTATLQPTLTSTLTPTPVPLAWKRLAMGLEFSRARIITIAMNPNDPEVIYVGTAHAGIYKSIDGGISWQPAHNGLGTASVNILVIDPQNPQTLYAAVPAAGVYKTTDGSESWIAVNYGIDKLASSYSNGVIISPLEHETLYYLSDKIYKSINGGASWTQMRYGSCPQTVGWLVVHPVDPQILFASDPGMDSSCSNGIYKSSDGGATWNITTSSNGLGGVLYIDHQDGQYLYAMAGNTLYGSSDGGVSWRMLATSTDPFYTGCAIHPGDGTRIVCSEALGTLRESRDAGSTWKTLDWSSSIGVSPFYLPQLEDGILVLSKGMYISNDGGNSWDEFSNGLGSGPLRLILEPANPASMYLEGPGNRPWEATPLYHSSDTGRTWELITSNGGNLAIDAEGITLYRSEDSAIMRSTDGGISWTSLNVPVAAQSDISTIPSRPGTVYLFTDTNPVHLLISTDGGRTWQEGNLPADHITLNRTKLVFVPDSAAYLATYSSGVYRSSDQGINWNTCSTNLSGNITDMAAKSQGSNVRLYLATQGRGVLISTNDCQSWQPSNNGLGSLFVNTVAIDPNHPDTVFAGTDGGAYISFDGGGSWGEINDGLLGATVVYSIVVDKDSNVYAATPYGIFKLEQK